MSHNCENDNQNYQNSELSIYDFIIHKDKNKNIKSCGFTIDSCFLKNNYLPFNDLDNSDKELLEILKDKSIPPGLLSLQNRLLNDFDTNTKLDIIINDCINSHINNEQLKEVDLDNLTYNDYENDSYKLQVINDDLYNKLLNKINENKNENKNKKKTSKNNNTKKKIKKLNSKKKTKVKKQK